MNNIFERIEIAESLGYISYGNCSDTPEQKTIAKWWNAENPSALVELPTLNELTIEKLERELADMTKQRDALAEAIKSAGMTKQRNALAKAIKSAGITKQRNALAEAIKSAGMIYIPNSGGAYQAGWRDAVSWINQQALVFVKGGSHG